MGKTLCSLSLGQFTYSKGSLSGPNLENGVNATGKENGVEVSMTACSLLLLL